MLATFLNVPELQLDEAEAKSLEDALKLMLPHANMALTPRQFDMLVAGEILLEVYGTRALAIYVNRQAAKKPPPKSPASVFTFTTEETG
jgi:hypothetical protein